ncbi:MAG: D-alanyl-D-alanine carboxypeptidase family protein [Cytophagales bacterium]|nr:D-alanyl-D-alanine carboxypeptidase family protein [Cytophagales bacterium]
MKYFFSLIVTAFSVTAFSITASAQTNSPIAAPLPPEIEARAYLLLDVTAGNQVLASKNADQPVEPASLTKLMTAYLAFEALKTKKLTLEQRLPVSTRAWKMEGSRMFIDPKMQVRVEDLLKGLIVQSGNDAAVALAEGVGGTVEGFVAQMNAKAAALGMAHTHYENPEGLTVAGHSTTAQDLAILATRLMNDFPDYIGYYAMQKFRLEGSPKSNDTNRNKLLFHDSSKTGFVVDGLKTGHTEAAGFCFVVTAKRADAQIGERRLLAILLGTASETARANEGEKLLVWGYNAFEMVKLFDAAAPLTAKVWKGATSNVTLSSSPTKSVLAVAIPAGLNAKVTSQIEAKPIVAPLSKGQVIAQLKVAVSGQPWQTIPLQANQDVALAGWLGRTWDGVQMMFSK